MLDIKWIRDNPEAFDQALAKRGQPALSASLIALDERRRGLVQTLQDMQARRNAASKEIGAAMAAKDSALADRLKAEVAEMKTSMPALEEESKTVDARSMTCRSARTRAAMWSPAAWATSPAGTIRRWSISTSANSSG